MQNPYQQQYQQPYQQQPYQQQPYQQQQFNSQPYQQQYVVQSPPPPKFDELVPKKEERFKQGQYKDVWASVLFLVCFLAFIGLSVLGFRGFQDLRNDINKGTTSTDIGVSVEAIIGCLLASIASGLVLSAIYFALIQRFAGKMIVITCVLNVLVQVLFGLYMLFLGSLIAGIILIALGALWAWVFYSWRHRIPFAKLLLKTVTSITAKFPATFFTGLLGLIVGAGFAVWWICAVVGLVVWANTQNMSNGARAVLNVYLIFFFYWAGQVIANTVHLTVSGLFATYYFMGISNGQGVDVPVKNPTLQSAKRALTTSFGSNCYGSLLIAIIQTLRALANQAKNESSADGNAGLAILFCCLQCILSLIEDILEYFNKYAFTQVAIYGKDYCTAAKDTWELFKRRGIDAIVNDSLVGSVLAMGSIMIGLITAAIAFGCNSTNLDLAAVKVHGPNPAVVYGVGAVIGLFIGIAEFSIIASVIDSGITTTFVCLAEDPQALANTKPELYQRIQQVYPQVMLGF